MSSLSGLCFIFPLQFSHIKKKKTELEHNVTYFHHFKHLYNVIFFHNNNSSIKYTVALRAKEQFFSWYPESKKKYKEILRVGTFANLQSNVCSNLM